MGKVVRDFHLDEFINVLRPQGVGTALEIPPAARDLFRAIAIFPDGSVGVMWNNENVVSFATINSNSEIQAVVPGVNDLLVGCKVIYIRCNR